MFVIMCYLKELLSPNAVRASYKTTHVLDMLMDDEEESEDDFEEASDSGVSDLSLATNQSDRSRR